MDKTIHEINQYPLDNSIDFNSTCLLDGYFSSGWCNPVFKKNVARRLHKSKANKTESKFLQCKSICMTFSEKDILKRHQPHWTHWQLIKKYFYLHCTSSSLFSASFRRTLKMRLTMGMKASLNKGPIWS